MPCLPISVLFVIPSLAYGGAETQLINQVNALQKDHSFQVSLLILSKDETLKDMVQLPAERIVSFSQPITYLNFRAVLSAASLVKQAADFVLAQKVDVVIANLPYAHFIMRLVKAISRLKGHSFKLVNYHHSMQYEESPLNSAGKKFFNQLLAMLTRFDDLNIFISQNVRDNIQQYLSVRNSVVIHNSVPFRAGDVSLANEYLAQAGILPGSFQIVIPGRVNEAKGQLFFIDAFRKFVDICKLDARQIQVILAGGGNLEEEAKKKIEANNLHTYFHVTGFIPNPLLLSFLHLADLVVIPSVNEGFGNVAIESLMVGSLILSSKAGGLSEIIRDGENGFLFETLNEDSLIEKLKLIYTNRNKEIVHRENLIEEFKDRYSFDNHMAKLIKVIRSCAE
jgi:glycosyltransferase involved in cell wall biosynthesis